MDRALTFSMLLAKYPSGPVLIRIFTQSKGRPQQVCFPGMNGITGMLKHMQLAHITLESTAKISEADQPSHNQR